MNQYEVIVVGGGHAGCEAALAAARMGARTALLSMSRNGIARMPCNPSIGGIAKAQLVFEIDVLGGEMARNTDYTGIQFRTLNTRRGPAVQSNRAQCDKRRYGQRMLAVLERTERLTIIEAMVTGIAMVNGRCEGVILSNGEKIAATCVVLTPGTFLRGTIHIGDTRRPGGRDDAEAATELSQSLIDLGLRLARLKTGTPPRLRRDSIDFGAMQEQPGDMPPPFFSWAARRESSLFHVEHEKSAEASSSRMFHVEPSSDLRPWQPGSDPLSCYLTHTTPETHRIIRDNLKRSSLYGGMIEGTGVRYCPSVEDKVVKFHDKDQHHVFIEPEGRDTDLIYPNGISNSLPMDVQMEMVHSVPGLERAEIVRWAYAIEYDFADPTQLCPSLESKLIENLFLAGQINGTTGYEEAAAQGFMAGVNACLKVRSEPSFVLNRNEAYIGVLIDDLVTKGTDEPYRMFTSRAEHRLLLRQDNARYRLLEASRRLGMVDPRLIEETECFSRTIDAEMIRLNRTSAGAVTQAALLRRPEVMYADLPAPDRSLPEEMVRQIEIRVKYQGYIERELRQVSKAEEWERQTIPASIDFWSLTTLKYESREKLSRIRPLTIGQAARIPGISPSDIAILAVAAKSHRV